MAECAALRAYPVMGGWGPHQCPAISSLSPVVSSSLSCHRPHCFIAHRFATPTFLPIIPIGLSSHCVVVVPSASSIPPLHPCCRSHQRPQTMLRAVVCRHGSGCSLSLWRWWRAISTRSTLRARVRSGRGRALGCCLTHLVSMPLAL